MLVIDAYGSLLYAGARTLQNRLPDPGDAVAPVVVLRLRGRLSLGATFAAVIADYVERLERVGGHLIMSGVQSPMLAKMERTSTARVAQAVELFEATEVIGESTTAAIAAGERWLEEHPASTGLGRTELAGDGGSGENDEGATPDEPSDAAPAS